MSALSIQPPYPTFQETDGQPLEDGYIWIGQANLDPQVNPINVYWDAALTVPAAQPIRTLGGYPSNNGTPARLYANSDYSIRVLNKNGSLVYNAPASTDGFSANFVSFIGFKGQIGTVQDLAGDDGSDWIGFEAASGSAVARSSQDKMRDFVSVFDYMTAAQVADVQANTALIDVTSAIQSAVDEATGIYFPAGTYFITAAIEIPNNRVLRGEARQSTIIKRTDGVQQTIDGLPAGVPIFYLGGAWIDVENMTLTGIVTDTTAIRFSNLGANSHINLTHLEINFCYYAFVESQGFFMTSFNNINVAECERAFTFVSNNGKTSLTFNNCYASSVGQAYDFINTVYSVMNACGCDYSNHPTEGGYGDPATAKGVYNFFICQMVMNGCGAEAAYGNGVINATSSELTINNITSYSCRSEYVPDYATYPNYAVGPVQLGLSWNNITASNLYFLDWQNTVVNSTYPTKPVASKIAYNKTSALPGTVFIHPGDPSIFAGQGDIINDCMYPTPTYEKTVHYKTLVGTGTVISIPITAQNVINRKHTIIITGLDGTSNGLVPLPFAATVSFVCLDVGPINIVTTGLQNVSSVAAAGVGSALNFTLSAARTNPLLKIELLSEQYSLIDVDGTTIA